MNLAVFNAGVDPVKFLLCDSGSGVGSEDF